MVLDDTRIGGQRSRFPATHWSAIVAVSSDDSDERRHGFDVIVSAYWKPVYKYIRIRWGKQNEDAKDLTQAFFTEAMEKSYFSKFDPDKARFRTYVRTCLDGFLANVEKAARRIKRGGGQKLVSLDFAHAENELSLIDHPMTTSPETLFDQEWIRHIFSMSVTSLKHHFERDGKSVHFQLFQRYDLLDNTAERPTYAELAGEFGLPVTKVTNYLALARREFRRLLLDKVREVTVTDEEFRNEVRSLLGSL